MTQLWILILILLIIVLLITNLVRTRVICMILMLQLWCPTQIPCSTRWEVLVMMSRTGMKIMIERIPRQPPPPPQPRWQPRRRGRRVIGQELWFQSGGGEERWRKSFIHCVPWFLTSQKYVPTFYLYIFMLCINFIMITFIIYKVVKWPYFGGEWFDYLNDSI